MFGTVFTGLALGMLAGPRVFPKTTRVHVFSLALGIAGVTLMAASFVEDFILANIFVATVGFCAGVAWIVGYTLVGQEVEDRLPRAHLRLCSLLGTAPPCSSASSSAPPPRPALSAHTSLRRQGSYSNLISAAALASRSSSAACCRGALLVGLSPCGPMRRRFNCVRLIGRWLLRSSVNEWRRRESTSSSATASTRVLERTESPGLFIAFEGGEGSGKSTQIAALADRLRRGRPRRPSSTLRTQAPPRSAVRIRELLLHHTRSRLGARAENDALRRRRSVTPCRGCRSLGASPGARSSSRAAYIDSSLAYQGVGRGLSAR